ncbi:GDSL-type esterase/lipase family protein [Spirosoma endophyticum]|uniref:GDSL-like Lipase/Acylhydrolase family protein n=1 Tax=Spirosoma endophyticum TaxID=662367 RepID=A0A1I1YVH1_9BACT|nr:GDSL-type esterase/lipase family protein [Spirosoma endophyticum]SFE22978.1 GDSL-like Lipase/Acylhydrolase family protein [Spirosoma endophyticum]
MVWYDAEVRQLEDKIATLPLATDRVIFYGSSSMRLWSTLSQDFPQINSLNLGFGGSTLAACAWFFERLIVPANPKSIVFYAGDNDLGDGRHPEEVYLFFCAFAEKLRNTLPDVPLAFLSIKISPARWNIAQEIRQANELICGELAKNTNYQYIDMTSPLLGSNGRPRQEFFERDGLHLSPAGYRAWQQQLIREARIF